MAGKYKVSKRAEKKQSKRGDDKHLKFPSRKSKGAAGGMSKPTGALGAGQKSRNFKPGKRKGHGGGKSVAAPRGRGLENLGKYKASHRPTFGRGAQPMSGNQGSPRTAGTDLGGMRKKTKVEGRLRGQPI